MMNKEQKCVAGIKLLSIEIRKRNLNISEADMVGSYVYLCENMGIPIKIMCNNSAINVAYIINRRVYDINNNIFGVSIDEYIMGVVSSITDINSNMIKTMFDFRNGVSLNRLRGGIEIGNCVIKSVPIKERSVTPRNEIADIIRDIKRTINL